MLMPKSVPRRRKVVGWVARPPTDTERKSTWNWEVTWYYHHHHHHGPRPGPRHLEPQAGDHEEQPGELVDDAAEWDGVAAVEAVHPEHGGGGPGAGVA